jgi:hypothetical protein
MTNFEHRLRDAGLSSDDVTHHIQSPDTALLLTARELVLLEPERIQRARLRDITGVKIVKTGELNVRSASEMLIEGNVLAFERTERKLFFDAVKEATAVAKASVTGGLLPPTPILEPAPSTLVSPEPSPASSDPLPALTSSAEDWRALTSTPPESPVPIFDTPTLETHPTSSEPVDVPSANLSDWDNPLTSESTLAVPPREDDPEDPWATTKQTFEVEPEKPAQVDPWISAPVTDPDAGWNDTFDRRQPEDSSFPSIAPTNASSGSSSLGVAASSANSDWSGDTLDAQKALGMEKSDMERSVSVTSNEPSSTLPALARWLKIMAVLFFLSGAAFTVSVVPQDAGNLLGYFVVLATFFGSVLVSLIAWSVSELILAYASSVQDLRAIRRATLGH